MNSNNKFGVCCKCPALMADGRIYTSFVPRKDLNYNLMREVNVSNANDYRGILQNNAEKLIASTNKSLNAQYKCVPNKNNTFYNVQNINKFFDDEFNKSLNSGPSLFRPTK